MINIKSLDVNIDKKSYKNVLIYYIGYVTIKYLRCVKIDRVNPLIFMIDK